MSPHVSIPEPPAERASKDYGFRLSDVGIVIQAISKGVSVLNKHQTDGAVSDQQTGDTTWKVT